jgi:hypothetical protein
MCVAKMMISGRTPSGVYTFADFGFIGLLFFGAIQGSMMANCY